MASLRALIVDDSPAMRRSIMFALQRLEGLSCVEAQDGVEGLKKFTQSPFDIVLTDINMPMMDGLKLISALRTAAAGAKVPIVVITTEAADADRERAMTLGANAYLTKPVQAKVVLDTVKSLLKVP
ncbi:MAG: response regulator [Myxococcaceae bacterium]